MLYALHYPQHVDYLNNDYAPDLIKFIQSRISGRKNASYYGFLKAIGEETAPSFDERQEDFVKYVSELLPIMRPYEYLIIQKLVAGVGKANLDEIVQHLQHNVLDYKRASFEHALLYMLDYSFF